MCVCVCVCMRGQSLTHTVHTTVVGGPQLRGLSGGEKKRLSLACELALQANIFLLDVSLHFAIMHAVSLVGTQDVGCGSV